MKKIVVSACLLGENCKYSGGNNYDPNVAELIRGREVIPVCPEVLAGLGIPRTPMEIQNGILVDKNGNVPDKKVRHAVALILQQLRHEDIEFVILKSRSPTCGVHQVYDGTFTGTLVDGSGVLAQALRAAGYTVMDNDELEGKINAGI